MRKRPGIGRDYLRSYFKVSKFGRRFFFPRGAVKQRLPRFFRDKIFNRYERALIAQSTIEESEIRYNEEIDRLSRLHPYPEAYFEERLRAAHDRVRSKAVQSRKL